MRKELIELNYKPITDFNENTQKHLNSFIQGRYKLENSEFFAKIVDQIIYYEMDDGSSFEHRISLTIFFLIDTESEALVDCFAIPSYPFEIKTNKDAEVLNNLCGIYLSDLKKMIEIEKNENSGYIFV